MLCNLFLRKEQHYKSSEEMGGITRGQEVVATLRRDVLVVPILIEDASLASARLARGNPTVVSATRLRVQRPSVRRDGLSVTRAARQKERWFRVVKAGERALRHGSARWKHFLGTKRALYKEEIGFERHVGW